MDDDIDLMGMLDDYLDSPTTVEGLGRKLGFEIGRTEKNPRPFAFSVFPLAHPVGVVRTYTHARVSVGTYSNTETVYVRARLQRYEDGQVFHIKIGIKRFGPESFEVMTENVMPEVQKLIEMLKTRLFSSVNNARAVLYRRGFKKER